MPSYQADRAFYYHYAWVIVAIIAAMQMVGTSMRMAFGVLLDPLTATFGWSQGEVTLAYAISSVVTALASPLAGSLGDRYGARRSMAAGTALFVLGMAVMALITQPWHLYVTFGAILGVAQAIFLVPLIPAAMNWFHRRLGLGMGVIMAAWGVGPALAAPLVGLLILEFGWSNAVWIITAGSGAIMVAMIALFRDLPSDKGLLPYGALPMDRVEHTRRAIDKQRIELFAGYMRRTGAYWNMSSIHFSGVRRARHHPQFTWCHLATQEGVSLVTAAGLLTVLSAVSVVTRLAHTHDVGEPWRKAGHGVLVCGAGRNGADAVLDARRVDVLSVRGDFWNRLRWRSRRFSDSQSTVLRTCAGWLRVRRADARSGPWNGSWWMARRAYLRSDRQL